jgi:hypothetical protein
MGKREKIPSWIEEHLQSEGKTIKRLFNDIDLVNPNVREAIEKDPTLTEEQKKYLLKTGSLPNQENYKEDYNKNTKYNSVTFSIFILVGIMLIFSSLNTTGFAVANMTEATPGLSGLILTIAGLVGLFLTLKK